MNILQQYWPLFVMGLWILYKWQNSKRIKTKLPELKKRGALLIDVRSKSEYSSANAPGTMNFPLQELTKKISETPRTTPIVLCCASGTRSGIAKLTLKRNGFKEVYNIGTWTNLLN